MSAEFIATPVPTLFCHEGNAAEFREALRAQPDALDLFRALHAAGLVDGIRGARIAPADPGLAPLAPSARPVLPAAMESRHLDREWSRQQEARKCPHK